MSHRIVMHRSDFLHAGLFLVLLLAMVGGVWWWMLQSKERSALHIEASFDVVENGLPVYAQFVVTQKIHLEDPVPMSRLVVPVFRPSGVETPLKVDLLHNGELQERWRIGEEMSDKAQEVSLSLTPPRLLDGELEIQFSAKDVLHDERELAPRIFIEMASDYFPGGSYRIADNEKEGNVGLVIYERVSRYQVWREQLAANPWLIVTQVFRLGALLLLVAVLPYQFIYRR